MQQIKSLRKSGGFFVRRLPIFGAIGAFFMNKDNNFLTICYDYCTGDGFVIQ